MKKASLVPPVRTLVLLFLFLLPVAVCTGQENNSNRQAAPPGPAAYHEPAAPSQQEEALREVARKEYNVCLEHCADDSVCMARCGKFYGRRIQSAHKNTTE